MILDSFGKARGGSFEFSGKRFEVSQAGLRGKYAFAIDGSELEKRVHALQRCAGVPGPEGTG